MLFAFLLQQGYHSDWRKRNDTTENLVRNGFRSSEMTPWLFLSSIYGPNIRADYRGEYDRVTLNDKIMPGDLVYLTLGGGLFGWGYLYNKPNRYREPQSPKEMMQLTIPGRVMQSDLISYNELRQMPELADVVFQINNESLIELSVPEANFLNGLFRSKGKEAPADISVGGKFAVPDATSLQNRLHLAIKRYNLASILFADLDKFKAVNDKYDHDLGDQVISETLTVVRGVIDTTGGELFHRSGDEMLVLLPNLNDQDSRDVADRIRAAIEEYEFPVIGRGLVTTTIGLATYPDTHSRWEDLAQVADQTAMKAKKVGRNRVASCSEDLSHLISRSEFDIILADGRNSRYQHGHGDIWRNNHQISLLIRAEHRTEVDVALARSIEHKDAVVLSFVFAPAFGSWDRLMVAFKEFVGLHKINWITFDNSSDTTTVHGERLVDYFPEIARLVWLRRDFHLPPMWRSSPRSNTSDPANSESISLTMLES
jgi:diguanylate cyclase (GGDEF)-like protein